MDCYSRITISLSKKTVTLPHATESYDPNGARSVAITKCAGLVAPAPEILAGCSSPKFPFREFQAPPSEAMEWGCRSSQMHPHHNHDVTLRKRSF